ncbi:MAG: hypothetical protein R3A79_25250 [Nannocystaceae bacterium]
MGEASWQGEERRRGDRRDPRRTLRLPRGAERRRGPRRRRGFLWREVPTLLLALGLGLAAAVALSEPRPAIAWGAWVAQIRAATADEGAAASLHAARSLRDEAEALTPAEVALDEQAIELWLPRLATIDGLLDEPSTPALVRAELLAARDALVEVGVADGP